MAISLHRPHHAHSDAGIILGLVFDIPIDSQLTYSLLERAPKFFPQMTFVLHLLLRPAA